MKTRRQRPPRTSARSTSTSGSLVASRVSISVWRGVILGPYAKKAGGRPLSVLLPAPAYRRESCPSSIASAASDVAVSGPFGVPPGPVAIAPVILPLGSQRGRQRKRLAGLAVAAELLHRAPQA